MDENVLQQAQNRIADALAAAGSARLDTARVDAALERSRAQVEALARAADDLETALPGRVSEAVREGLRTEVLPVARQLAEIRGLLNGVVRRLDDLEAAVTAERHARIDDLALLVDLVSSGWQSVDERLSRLEQPAAAAGIVRLPADAAAA
jgi:hypothetical protein